MQHIQSGGAARAVHATIRLSVLSAAVAALFQAPLHAADVVANADAADPATPISVVEIVGTLPLAGDGQQRAVVAAPVQTASAADIARSQAADLSAFLNSRLGSVYVNEMQNNPFQPDVSFRGYTASPLLGTPQGLSVYLDGVRLNQPFGDVVSWDLVPRAAISTLTLMPGSNPLFGLNTLGGALALRTKDGRSDPGTALQVSAGAGKRRTAEFEHGGSNADGLNWYVTGNRFKEDGWREDSPSDVRQLFGKLGWADSRTDVALTLALADNRLTGNGLQEQRLLAQDYRSVYTRPDQTENRSLLLNLEGKHRIDQATLASGNLYYRRIRSSTLNGDLNDDSLDQSVYQPSAAEQAALKAAGYSGYPASGATAANTPFPSWRCIANVLRKDEPAEKCNGLLNRSDTTQHNAGASGQLTRRDAGNEWSVGAAYDQSSTVFHQSSQFGYLTPDRGIVPVNFFADGTEIDDDGTPVDSRVDLSGKVHTWSVYASDTLRLAPAWNLTVSGRYNRSTVRNRDHLNPGGGSGSLDGDHTFQRVNPAIGLSYAPDARFGAYAGYNEGSRMPTSIELGCADPANPCRLPNAMAGDPPLRQVVTRTAEGGVRGRLDQTGGLNWRAGLFRADNSDDILFVADNQAGFGYFKNFGKTRHQGVELGLDGKRGALSWSIDATWLDATYQSAEVVNGSGNSSGSAAKPGLEGTIRIAPGDRIPLTPDRILKAQADYDAGAGFTLGAAMRALSGSYARGNENNQHQASGVNYLGSGKTAGYAVVDLNAHYQATRRLGFFMQVANLLDRRYASAAQLGATGFNATGGFVARPYAAVNGKYPLTYSTFYAPGAPRAVTLGARYAF